ncbi:hypothetical protein GCM10007385_39220 [Tateyamaria omphalii]|nr:hypothetical protein GCM10007385_39220 [Tateyamaria omphalii]
MSPVTKTAIGPAIQHILYYDFDRKTPFMSEGPPLIEREMREVIVARTAFTREVWSRERAFRGGE